MPDLPTGPPAEHVPAHPSGTRDTRSTDCLFREYAATRNLALRDELVVRHQRLVHYFAFRLATTGCGAYEDLAQVGYLGLIHAIDRFDPDHGNSFVTYAAPTIIGEIKRYLRDQTWGVKVPRRLRELGVTLQKVRDQLSGKLGRVPTLAEMAAETGATEEKIAEAMELERAYQPLSLDAPRPDDAAAEGTPTWEGIGQTDPRLDAIEEKETLRRAIQHLEAREQAIIYGRFYGEATQQQIAEQLGMSQMHVSRLERRALKQLRQLLSDKAQNSPPSH